MPLPTLASSELQDAAAIQEAMLYLEALHNLAPETMREGLTQCRCELRRILIRMLCKKMAPENQFPGA